MRTNITVKTTNRNKSIVHFGDYDGSSFALYGGQVGLEPNPGGLKKRERIFHLHHHTLPGIYCITY